MSIRHLEKGTSLLVAAIKAAWTRSSNGDLVDAAAPASLGVRLATAGTGSAGVVTPVVMLPASQAAKRASEDSVTVSSAATGESVAATLAAHAALAARPVGSVRLAPAHIAIAVTVVCVWIVRHIVYRWVTRWRYVIQEVSIDPADVAAGG